MYKSALRQWTCSTCRLQRRAAQRGLAVAATAVGQVKQDGAATRPVYYYEDAGNAHDDRTLRQIFDSPGFWADFSKTRNIQSRSKPTGLFQNRHLTSPEGFQAFTAATLKECRQIVDKVKAASSVQDYIALCRDLDRLSDYLCRAIDLSDFVRSTHPDRGFQRAALLAHQTMFQYMNELNTTTELNEQLKRALANPAVTEAWSDEEKTVAMILRKDFSNSAIDLCADDRQRFVDLSNDINELGTTFVENMAPARSHIEVASSKLKGLDPRIRKPFTRWGTLALETTGPESTWALRTIDDEATRKELYMAHRTSDADQIDRLGDLLQKRFELANLCGYDTYADMALTDKMAKSPASVITFLDALSEDNKSRTAKELAQLLHLKQAASPQTSVELNAWDRDYYTNKYLAQTRSKSRTPDFLSAYFSLGTVMQGLSRLFHRLYGIRLVAREPSPGETWQPDVRRLDVIDDIEGHIAVIYCDLFERAGKSPNPAHFTIRCSRRISDDELASAASASASDTTASTGSSLADAVAQVTDGMASSRNAQGELFQLPTIALICDFPPPSSSSSTTTSSRHTPTLLNFRDVETLFHEMGHALQSVLGRTTLQNVSGTRCATDFAELPSVLLERFARAPEVLALFARHWQTDAPLPYQMIEDRRAVDARFQGADIEAQLVLAVLDQRYHGRHPLSDTSAEFRRVIAQYGSLVEPRGTSWQGFFGHLFGYGATYYSYLFDRAIAGKIWKDVFQRSERGAVDPDAGRLFRKEVLRWGGSRDGWTCIAAALDDPSLAEGDAAAMAAVGRWGVEG
ncbi:MAG: hypothetical protein M1825_001724 [Sarcosagium campestre]|nr:MAG: hypothetical protein M1825_001724 [Sarcosagium campestre]